MTTTYRSLALRGVAAGGISGLAAGLVGLLLVEIPIRAALAVEESRQHTGGGEHSHEEALVSRPLQLVGGVLAPVIVGLAIGLVFATAYAMANRWFVDRTPFSRSLSLGVAVFGAAALLPFLKYPPNPPAVGDPDTVDFRTVLYLGVIAAGLVIVYGASRLAARLQHLAAPVRTTAVLLAVVAATAIVLLVFPASPDAIPADMPTAVLWQFRLSSLAETATMYVGLGLVFGLLVDPAVRKLKTTV
ncbi:membrane protein [Lentzea sp. NBRC 105346]|uniref:CbtA family protein n=1 Tax=Lentzea sp. NBRC 105346 TaxID=3032205 RepID=UPI0024A3B5F4|nr:CbtA family protein [Lentzea sp. NBRC 105346]GLZ31584.1 membrane protein [Lentzea sp. NBRC 105346]